MLVCPLCRLTLGDNETTCSRDGREGVEAQPTPLPQAVRARFDIVEPYARGASGDLYLADDRKSGRRGVLKLIRIPEQATPAEKARLKRELVKQATLTHDILTVPLATGEADGHPWVFRDWHEGVSLAVRLARGGALAVPEAVTIAAQIASALDELHRAGLLHRDLKPGHVIVEPQPSGLPRVRVIDAGVAARLETGAVFDVMGTPEYLSPEQAKGKLVSFRSDLYALGCILFEMLGGAPPFAGSIEELLEKHSSESAPTLQVEMPGGVSSLLSRLLSKEPRERPFSAQQVRRALEPFLPEDASSKREATQAFDQGADAKRRVPSPRTSGTLPPPSARGKTSVPPPPPRDAKKGASVPPPPSKSKPPSPDRTEELGALDLAQAEELTAAPKNIRKPVRQTSKTLMGMPVSEQGPSAEGTEELNAVDLEQAEEVLAKGAGSAAAAASSPPTGGVGLGSLSDAAPQASAPDSASSPAAAPPWEAEQLRMSDPGAAAAGAGAEIGSDEDDLDYDDLAETVMYDREGEGEGEAEEAAAAASAAAPSVRPAAVSEAPTKIPGARPWGLIVLGVLAAGCLVSTVGVGGALWFLSSSADDVVAAADDAIPEPPAVGGWAPEPVPAPSPEPTYANPTPVAAPTPAPEPAPVEEPAEEPVEEPVEEPAPVQAQPEPREERTPREEATPREERRPAQASGDQEESGGGRQQRFEAAREEALGHFRARRFAQAASAYERATTLNPRHAGSYAGLGACYLAMGQAPRAVRAYQRAIQLSPRHAGFYAALGQAYHHSGDTARARQAYTRALALDPNNRAARTGLSHL